MTTLCAVDLSESERTPSDMPISLFNSKSAVVRGAVRERCKALGLGHIHTEAAIDAARAELAFGGSAAKATAAGVSCAERLAKRLGAQWPRDPDPSEAA